MVRVSRGLQARKTTRRVSLAQGFRPYSSLHSLFTRWIQKWLAASSIVVVIPELVEDKWYEHFLHNQRGRLLEWVLLARGNERIFTVSAPWYVVARS